MDLDSTFVASVLVSGIDTFWMAIRLGIDEDHLDGDGLKAWRFVVDYVKKYKDVPTFDQVNLSVGVQLDIPPPAPEDYYMLELRNRRLHNEVGRWLLEIEKWHHQRQPHEAYSAYEEAVRELRSLKIATQRTQSLPSLGQDFLDFYDKLKNGYRGIQTPWPTVNESTLGFWPEDFVLYVARLGVGKTWALTIIADHVWSSQKKRVLFVTTEMSQMKIVQRWIAVHFKYPYNDLRKGHLSAFAEQKMRDTLQEIKDEEGLYIIGGDFDFKISSLEAAIEEAEPDIVLVDGVYLLKSEGDGRIERAANSFDELKRTAKRNHVPLVASTQFNREVKGNKMATAGPDKIALSDAAGWNADLIYGLVRTEDMVKDRRMIQLQLKFREGEGEDIETHWDFDTMNFDELPKGSNQGGGGFNPVIPPQGGSGGTTGSSGTGGSSMPDPDPYGTGMLFGQNTDDQDTMELF